MAEGTDCVFKSEKRADIFPIVAYYKNVWTGCALITVTVSLLMNHECRMCNLMMHLVTAWPERPEHHSWTADVFVNSCVLYESQ